MKNVKREKDSIIVHFGSEGENTESFDAIVFATHSDQSLEILEQPTKDEEEILGAIEYQNNSAILHFDDSILPKIIAEHIGAMDSMKMGWSVRWMYAVILERHYECV